MSDCIKEFFGAWQIEEAEPRLSKISGAVTQDVRYDDPRTTETLIGIDALDGYLAMFSSNALGWSAKVQKSDTIGNVTRVTVAFSGAGPDGSEHVQLGQYFIEKDDGLISRIVGFVGTGE